MAGFLEQRSPSCQRTYTYAETHIGGGHAEGVEVRHPSYEEEMVHMT